MNVHFTVDVEQDCPPYLDSWRGIEEGMPKLLGVLEAEGIRATFFTTGEAARRYPAVIRTIVDAGHELGCHGDTHRSFAALRREAADRDIRTASASLRAFAPVVSFRAPYLRFPRGYLDLLPANGYTIDSSQGRHKHLRASLRRDRGVLRVPASITSSALRWPVAVRNALLANLTPPVVLFVHPWEFVDLRGERLRFDCRFKTGDAALEAIETAVRFLKRRAATFSPIRDCAA